MDLEIRLTGRSEEVGKKELLPNTYRGSIKDDKVLEMDSDDSCTIL